jgi:Ca2+-binding EF-hand superfamily protein
MEEMKKLFTDADQDRDGAIKEQEFVQLMRSLKVSMYDAVKYDIDEGLKR